MAIPSLIGISRSDVTVDMDLSTVEGVLMFYTEKIIQDCKDNLEESGSNASYQLSQSIRPEFEVKTEKFGIKYIARISMEEYYEWVDKGRPAGKQPPISSIINWIANKEGFQIRGLDKVGDIRERGINKKKAYTREDVIRSNAFGIAAKIGLKGTQPTSFFTNAVNQELYTNLNRDLSKALKRDVEVSIKNMIDTKELLSDSTIRY